MAGESISQEAAKLPPLRWTAGDKVHLTFNVRANWAGTYTAQIRKKRTPTATLIGTFQVTATWPVDLDGNQTTLFELDITKVASQPILKGSYYTDIQDADGLTRLWAQVIVGPQVTVP